ncbi:response regulator transcription factor [Variovorax sp. PCZ-1]|uniref:response regulator n=1 Tax=Variovorax sp. PCZ-1 TaxID=2835533 RepID=UPI001BCD89D9|nr:response regulator transcription factor [Variovorax sp. PCZ-1]MBS7806772.1 response regulator transcription factor [Variovorax sp. PCZ-1]
MKAAFVEDDPLMHRKILRMLSLGFPDAVITSFQTLADASVYALKEKQDYWLVDLGLPDGSGITLIGILRKRYPQTNILVLTVLEDTKNIIRSIQAGANGYLLKQDLQTDDQLPVFIKAINEGGTPLSPVVASRLLERMQVIASQPASLELEQPLAPREAELLQLLSRGYSYQESAQLMLVSLSTVQTLVKRCYSKLGVHSRTEAIFEAKTRGVLRS